MQDTKYETPSDAKNIHERLENGLKAFRADVNPETERELRQALEDYQSHLDRTVLSTYTQRG